MAQIDSTSALVLFSGGQDSTTCLAWALERYHLVETIGFSYGQRHAIELTVREPIRQALAQTFPKWSNRLGQDHVISLERLLASTESALLGDAPFGTRADGLPSTFVPGRNIIFITIAGILAKQRNIKVLVTGTCETDFSGYPDCRDDTIKALQVTLNLGLDARLAIETPLMWIDKASTWGLAADIGGEPLLEIILAETHTCYLGDRGYRHPWGYGCATCDACKLRARGWTNYANDRVQPSGTKQ